MLENAHRTRQSSARFVRRHSQWILYLSLGSSTSLIGYSIDFIGNNCLDHNLRSRRLRCRTRRLCKLHANSIARSEKYGLVFRNVSFTMRAHLAPPILCSTRTRSRDKARLWRFSPRVNAPPRGFFSADTLRRRAVHSLESRYPCPSACGTDN